jgi:hypothetical protein
MVDHVANIGSTSLTEAVIATGRGPHVFREYLLKSGLGELAAGLVAALDANGAVVPYDVAQVETQDGDGALTDFTFDLGGAVEPGSVSVTDGTETFSDDGFGVLTGDASGSGKVNYQTGAVSVSFNAAPADATGNVECSFKPVIHGVLNRKAENDAARAELLVLGQVDRKKLLVDSSAPSAAQLLKLDKANIWPVG